MQLSEPFLGLEEDLGFSSGALHHVCTTVDMASLQQLMGCAPVLPGRAPIVSPQEWPAQALHRSLTAVPGMETEQ